MSSGHSNDLAKLRHVELKTKENESISSQSSAGNDGDSCCEQCLWRLRNLVPVRLIFHCISTTLTKSYDLITILISVADVTTDIWVIYNFRIAKRDTFFIIALIVMILAQLSYAVAFMLRFRVSEYNNYRTRTHRLDWDQRVRKRVQLFFLILPFTPVISFIFYWCTQYPDNCLMSYLKENFNIQDDYAMNVNPNQARIVVWVEEKLNKHIGFILEGNVYLCVHLYLYCLCYVVLLFCSGRVISYTDCLVYVCF